VIPALLFQSSVLSLLLLVVFLLVRVHALQQATAARTSLVEALLVEWVRTWPDPAVRQRLEDVIRSRQGGSECSSSTRSTRP